MKSLVILTFISIFFIPCINSAQESNPDGEIGYLSIHFTPLYYFGSSEYFSGKAKIGIDETKPKFSFEALVKYPVSESFTISGFYRMSNYTVSSSYSELYLNDEYKTSQSTVGITFSFYTGSGSRYENKNNYKTYVKR